MDREFEYIGKLNDTFSTPDQCKLMTDESNNRILVAHPDYPVHQIYRDQDGDYQIEPLKYAAS